jgi:hypothetical protein
LFLIFAVENSMNRDATSKTINAFFLAGFLAIAISTLFGCAQDTTMRTSGGDGMSKGSSSTGIGTMTGGAEASPTADPGVTPGKKP